jgi:hypothetical protein
LMRGLLDPIAEITPKVGRVMRVLK